MKSLFSKDAHTEILNRLDQLTPETQAEWGKMDVAQMFAHCCEPLKVPLEKLQLKKPNVLFKFLFSFFKASLYNDKPWKKGIPTAPEFKVVDSKDFQVEKQNLIALINEFYDKGKTHPWPLHPFAGDVTTQQWGQMQYKHLDHHLRQFGK